MILVKPTFAATRYERDLPILSQRCTLMIFRQLLRSETGCASYVFG